MLTIRNKLKGKITQKQSLKGKLNIAKEYTYPALINLEVNPTSERQVFNHEGSYGYDEVVVNAVSEEYIIPDGEIEISENGSYDVKEYASAKVDIKPEGVPEKGIIIQEWDSSGYPLKVKVVGMTEVPEGYLSLYTSSSSRGNFFKNVTHIVLSDGVTKLNNYVCAYLSNLENIVLPNTITNISDYVFNEDKKLSLDNLPSDLKSIGNRAFYNNTNLTIEQLPDDLKTIGEYAFYNSGIKIKTIPENVTSLDYSAMASCKNIIQLSTTKVSGFGGGGTSNGGLRDCTNLKALWIGTNNGVIKPTIYRYAFNNNTSLQKIYIDLPRATVETISGYQYAFMNDESKIGIIICNDDEGFITKEEFDAIDWSVV